jgi:hypothetical protein
MNTYKVTITCKGKPIPEYVFENIQTENELQARAWAVGQILPHHKINKIVIKEVNNAK